jgi:hypothetical protein
MYRIRKATLVKRERVDIYTTDIEKERKRIMSENPGFQVHLTYDTLDGIDDNGSMEGNNTTTL